MLNALATVGIALLAGADATAAAALGLSMLCLQSSIGAVNDLADAELDRVGKPTKPIPAGLVSVSVARAWALLMGVLGLLVALAFGASTLAVAAAGVGLGYAYDLRLSRTALAWLPLALALPLLPLFAWLGATGTVPGALLGLVPAAALAGTGLSLGNGLVDLEGDRLAGKPTIAVRLGRRRSWALHAGALALAVLLAFVLAPAGMAGVGADGPGAVLGFLGRSGLPVGTVLIGAGAGLLLQARPDVRERGWEIEAIGTALLGLGWMAGLAAGGSVAGG